MLTAVRKRSDPTQDVKALLFEDHSSCLIGGLRYRSSSTTSAGRQRHYTDIFSSTILLMKRSNFGFRSPLLSAGSQEAGWIRSIQRGKGGAAAESMVRTYYPEVLRYLKRQVHDHSLAQDLAQEVFIAVLRHIGGFDATKASFRMGIVVMLGMAMWTAPLIWPGAFSFDSHPATLTGQPWSPAWIQLGTVLALLAITTVNALRTRETHSGRRTDGPIQRPQAPPAPRSFC